MWPLLCSAYRSAHRSAAREPGEPSTPTTIRGLFSAMTPPVSRSMIDARSGNNAGCTRHDPRSHADADEPPLESLTKSSRDETWSR